MGGQKGEGNRRGARAGGMENGGGEREDRRVCAREQKGEGDRRGGEDWGGQEAREREGRGASERLVVVKTLSSWLEGRYCGI